MAEITLVVTQRVVNHTSQGHPDETQMAIRAPTPDIAPTIRQLTKTNRRTLRLGGCIDLTIGDTSAIHRSQNIQQVEDFDALFELLARRPDHAMRFLCEVI
jgi:hypothetical protein